MMASKIVLVSALICLCISVGTCADSRQRRAAVKVPLPEEKTGADPDKKSDILPENPAKGEYAMIGDKPKGAIKIAESADCQADVQRLCADKAKANNFLVLDCLQDSITATESLSTACDHYLWNYKKKLSTDIRFDSAVYEACKPDLNEIEECKNYQTGRGQVIPCLIDHYEAVKSVACRNFLNKMASIIFSDFHFMEPLMVNCSNDIEKLKCGRLENPDVGSTSSHLQGKTISCLNEHRKNVSKPCKKVLLKVAELQSDDYHLDRPLYYACKGDRESLCHTVNSGDGAVFKCLYKHLGDPHLTPECKEKLEARQALIAEDVKADKSFYKACRQDIKQNECHKRNGQLDDDVDDSLRKSSVLLCLEKVQSDGEQKVSPSCMQAMFELRSELMQDYKISPELVDGCRKEIASSCQGLEVGGGTINCLMKLAMTKSSNANAISTECTAQLSQLLHVANPGEDIRLDRPLQRACGDVVTKACHDHQAGHGDVITCLLENVDHEDMTDECEEQLLIIQYFAVRDFRLDQHLYKQCQRDALHYCKSDGFTDPNTMEPEHGPLIFSCLHRLMRSEDPHDPKLSRGCTHEVKRVLRERSTRVRLMPEVEGACMKELSEMCSADQHKEVDKEMECLQENFDSLEDECRAVVANFTEEEMGDFEMDRILMKSCTPMIKTFCKELLDSDAMPNEVLDCLIEHKNNVQMNDKCAAGIEHHQIISLKDFRFNHKFRDACQSAVAQFCKNKKTKYDVVACLSEHVRNDTLLEKSQRIEAGCQKQLRFELLQRGESIKLDPKLEKACREDVAKFCKNKKQGEGEVLECLRSHKKKLKNECHKVVFEREKDEAMFGDYTVLHLCKKMIQKYCSDDANEDDIMSCLKDNKDAAGFDDRCRQIVLRRQIEQSQDYRLNPHLQKACRLDIPKYCAKVYDGAGPDEEMDGKVIDCLKKQYAKKANSLSTDCEHEVKAQIKEAALDINQNPVLMKTCKSDIKLLCLDDLSNNKAFDEDEDDDDKLHAGEGAIIECLKKNFFKLQNPNCKKEVAFTIAESRVDVQVDPILQSTCQKDLIHLCKTVPQGQGRQMSCLLAYLESDENSLTRNCREMLKRRKDLWEYAAKVAPVESLQEIYEQISTSPSRNYFFAILFSVVGVIFIVGLTCGRVTKRVRAEMKNK